MEVTFSLHTPPAKAPHPGEKSEPAVAVPYISIDTGPDQHFGRTHHVVKRAATPEDQVRYPKEWAAFQAELAAKSKPPAAEPKPAEAKGAGKK